MTEVTMTFETDMPSHIDRVLFEAIQRGARSGAPASNLEILSQLMIAAIRSEAERWDQEASENRDARTKETIHHAVMAARDGDLSPEAVKHLGMLRSAMIKNSLAELKGPKK